MVFTNKYSKALMEKFPKFSKSSSLKDAIDLGSDGKAISACLVFTGLTDYVVDELIGKNEIVSQDEIDIYNYIERKRIEFSSCPDGSEERNFDEAACACFLENLINMASNGRFPYSRFIPYLDEKSKEYCRAWDEFTGVKSPGLWDDKH